MKMWISKIAYGEINREQILEIMESFNKTEITQNPRKNYSHKIIDIAKRIYFLIKNNIELGYFLNKINYDTSDRVIIVENNFRKFYYSFFYILVGTLWFYSFIFIGNKYHKVNFILLFHSLVAGFFFLCGLWILLVSKSVTTDNKLQSLIINIDYFINIFKSYKMIPFLNIKYIQIKKISTTYDIFNRGLWNVNIIMFNGESSNIYSSFSKSDAENISYKIQKLINKKPYPSIVYPRIVYDLTDDYYDSEIPSY